MLAYAGVLVLHPGHGYVVWRDGWLANLVSTLPGIAASSTPRWRASGDRGHRASASGC